MKLKAKISSLALAACIAFTASAPAFAAETKSAETFDVQIEAVEEDLGIGEAKFKVSVSGAENATLAQLAFEFEGSLDYSDVKFMIGKNKVPDDMWVYPSVSSANANKKFTLAVIGDTKFSDNQDLFIISFTGKAGKDVTLKMSDTSKFSYCKVGDDKIYPSKAVSKKLTGSETGVKTKKGTVKLTLDGISAFTPSNDPAFTVIITKDDGFTSSIAVSNETVGNGGHRVITSDTTPVFKIDKTVTAGSTYTVEVMGVGYVPYKQTGVTFDKTLDVTNAEFVPGDADGDGDVDGEDKKIVQALSDDENNEEYAEYKDSADFNRDGYVDDLDMKVFAKIKDSTGDTSGDKKDDKKDDTKDDNTDDGDNGDDEDDGKGGSSGGGGGGSSKGSSGGGVSGGFSGGYSANTVVASNETFTDLANHAWAKDSIYTLKNKGIISGISDTEFAPANNIRRCDFILILTRMLGINDTFTENFADVPADAYYYNAVGSAKAAEIANGDGGNFMPENTITRQDLITLAYRAFLNKGYIAETDDLSVLDAFADSGYISDYAKGAMASMVKAGIIQGADGGVNPQGFATRAEVAVMCARMLNLMK